MQQRAIGGVNLLQVSQHVAVCKHRAFRHAGCPASILQERQIFRHDFGLHILHAITVLQRTAKRDGIRQVIFRHQTLDILDDEVNQRPFGGGQLIAHTRQDHVLHRRFVDYFFQRVGKVRYDDNRRRAAIVELMFQLARRVQRVYVHDDHAGT